MRYRASLAFVAALLGGLQGAAAQTLMERLECTGDAMRLCSEYVPNHQLIAQCMEQKHDQLSPDCRVVFDAGMRELRRQGRQVP